MIFDATDELRGLTKNDTVTNRFVKKEHDHFLEVETFNQFLEKEAAQMILPFPLSEILKDLEKELDQDFSHDNNVVCEKKKMSNTPRKVYSPTRVKAQNFLTNISYSQVKEADLENSSFVIDCYTFILLYLNPFHLEQKFEEIIDREKVEAL